jgi:signal transduction histidine kinase
VAAADAERRRIQRDLHDGAQQSLLAAAVTARLARQHWDTSPARTAELLGRLRAELDQAATDLRGLAHGIYPPVLTDLGLPAALTAAAARCPRPVTVHAGSTARYPPAVEAAIYFCCLEALHNAAKHAGDRARITVTLRHHTSGLACEITDDGAGLTSTSTSTGTSAGAGLANMADRIAAVGGQLRIDSTPGRGTTVRATAPARRPTSPGTADQPGA